MISVLQIRGQTGSKTEFSASVSQSILKMLLIFGLEEHIMVLHVYVKFWVMYDFSSQDMGSNGVQNGVFRESLKKYMLYIADFRAERNYYGT